MIGGPLDMLMLALAGGLGATCRYALDRALTRRRDAGPIGIFAVNVLASILIGLLAGIGLAGDAVDAAAGSLGPILATGLLGGFSTFSTVAVDSARLLRARRFGWVAANTLGMLVISVTACAAAIGIVRVLA